MKRTPRRWKTKLMAGRDNSGAAPGLLRRLRCDSGAQIVEMALVMPVTLIVLTGLLSFGTYINNNLELTNATSLAGQYLAESRSITTNPCSDTYTNIQQVAPTLVPASMSFSLVLSGAPAPYTGTTCSSAAAYMTQGATAQLTVTYPCSLAIYGANLAPGCVLTSQITEIVQ
jgi:Flp pilus assembly protein TadG